jgi:hypothetical protein
MLEQMLAKREEIMAGDSCIKLQLVNILDRIIDNYQRNVCEK